MKTGIFYNKKTGEPVQIVAQAQTRPTFQRVICYQELTAPYEHFVMERTDFFAEYVREFEQLSLDRQKQIGKRADLPDKQPRISKGVVQNPEDAEEDSVEKAESEEGDENTRRLVAFFDAPTYHEKIKILESMKDDLDERMLNNLAVSLDLSIEDGVDGYEFIMSELEIRSKYELIRRE